MHNTRVLCLPSRKSGLPPIKALVPFNIKFLFDAYPYLYDKSLSWSAHLRTIFKLYQLADPLVLLDTSPWPKVRWKHHVQALVTSYHERVLRYKAATNSKLSFLNVQTLGLSGRLHPTIAWVQTTQDVEITLNKNLKSFSGGGMSTI